jgi:hypothetical protein
MRLPPSLTSHQSPAELLPMSYRSPADRLPIFCRLPPVSRRSYMRIAFASGGAVPEAPAASVRSIGLPAQGLCDMPRHRNPPEA